MSDRFSGPSPKRYFWTPKDLSRKVYGQLSDGAGGDPRSYEYYQRGWLDKYAYAYSLFPTVSKTPFNSTFGDYVIEPQFKIGVPPPPGHNYLGVQNQRFTNGVIGPFGDSNAIAFPPNQLFNPALLGWDRGARPTASGVVMSCWVKVALLGANSSKDIFFLFSGGFTLYMSLFSDSSGNTGLLSVNSDGLVPAAVTTTTTPLTDWALVTATIYPTGATTYGMSVALTPINGGIVSGGATFDTALGDPPIDWLDQNPTTIGVFPAQGFSGLISRPVFAICDGSAADTQSLAGKLSIGGFGVSPMNLFGGALQ